MNTLLNTLVKPLALAPGDCQGKHWLPPQDIDFAKNWSLLPLHAGELARAAASMPLAIFKAGQEWQLVGVCGLQDGFNLFIRQGQWQGAYQPVCLQSWPLSIYRVGEQGFPVFDQNSDLLVEASEGRGEPFFNEQNQPSAEVTKRLELLGQTQGLQAATSCALRNLGAAGVITPIPDAILQQAGVAIEGLHMVDERALSQLSGDAFLELRQALPVAYAVNFSIQQLHLLQRLARMQGISPSSTPDDNSSELDLFGDDDDTLSFG